MIDMAVCSWNKLRSCLCSSFLFAYDQSRRRRRRVKTFWKCEPKMIGHECSCLHFQRCQLNVTYESQVNHRSTTFSIGLSRISFEKMKITTNQFKEKLLPLNTCGTSPFPHLDRCGPNMATIVWSWKWLLPHKIMYQLRQKYLYLHSRYSTKKMYVEYYWPTYYQSLLLARTNKNSTLLFV